MRTIMRPLLEDWQFDVLGIYKYRRRGKLQHYYNFIMENCKHLEGDIIEAGVYNGKSLLATGLLLTDLKSDKKVYGFDSFKGFPPEFHENDYTDKFVGLCADGKITEQHLNFVKLNNMYVDALLSSKSCQVREEAMDKILKTSASECPSTISTSGDFSDVDWHILLRKIDMLDLSNVVLVPGFFEDTMTIEYPEHMRIGKIMAALLDCDLYLSYKTALPFLWERLVQGGYIFLDEYYSLKYPGPRIAVDEFFEDKKNKPQKCVHEWGQFERWYVKKTYEE